MQAKMSSSDIFRTIELGSVLKLENTDNWFLLFNHSIPDSKTDVMERIAGFGNPALFGLLNGKIDLHIDTSFYVVRKSFYQMLVIMAYDPQTGSYVPCAHVLMTGKCAYFNSMMTNLCFDD